MKHQARWIALGIGAVVVAFSVLLASQVGSDPRADTKTSQLAGRAVPKFTVTTLDGETLSSRDLAGKAVIVNFWNSWCIPCREEHPALKQFYARHADDPNVVLLGIVRDDTKAAAQRWVDAKGDDWTIATDPGGKASLAFGTRGQPETFAVSPDGLVMGYQFGPSSVQDLEQLLSAARAGVVNERTRRWAPWIVLGVVVISVLAWAAWPSGTRSDADRARAIASELRCPDCESLSAADSQTQSARAIRRDVQDRIAEGQSDGEIRRAYADRYGESILLKPESDGLGLLVWGLPVVLLVIGLGGLFIALRRWRRTEPLQATEADEALVRSVRERPES